MNQPLSSHPRVRQSGSFYINLPPAEATKLFTAEGERLWVPNWTPEILGPLPQGEGLVFFTGTGPQRTIWTVIESRPAEGRVVTGVDKGSKIDVSYDLTALNAADSAALEAYSPSRFAEMMEEWRALIENMLASSRPSLTTLVV